MLGDRAAFFVAATPYPHYRGMRYRQRELLPLTLSLLQRQEQRAGGGVSGERQEHQQEQQQVQAAALFYEIAADQSLGKLRVLGCLLCHLFR